MEDSAKKVQVPPQSGDGKPSGGSAPQQQGGQRFVKWFRHWRSGELIVASDYGLEAFPIGGK